VNEISFEGTTSETAPAEVSGWSGRAAAEIVGITYRQLDYWARTDLVRPTLADARGSGSRRKYSYRDLLELKVIKNLLDAGIKLESVRTIFAYLRDHLGGDISSANLVINGSRSVLVQNDGELIDVLRSGQGVLNVLPLSGVKDEVDAGIVQLRPSAGSGDDEASDPEPQVPAPPDLGVSGTHR
jgi:DNA-binding transcriptional MerR regulator